ncbi:MAG TPA: Hsp20/alpha crystallin family protein [Candidatus Saccharimonadales bacterium]
MALVRWNDPFSGMMHTPFDDLFNGVWGGSASSHMGGPAMNVYTEDDKSLVAEVEVPGFTKDEIEVNVHDDVLEIKGEKQAKEETGGQGKRSYMLRESHESFYRSLRLPKVADGDRVSAHFDNGMLKVTVPFRELPAPKRVTISDGGKVAEKTAKKK